MRRWFVQRLRGDVALRRGSAFLRHDAGVVGRWMCTLGVRIFGHGIVMGDPWRNATVAMKVHFSGSGSREDLSASSALDSLDIM